MHMQFLGSAVNRARPYLPIALVGAVAVAASLTRLVDLGQPQLSRDEAASWYLSSRPLPNLLTQSAYETFPPLYPLLLKVWMLLFGESEAAVRSFSIAAWVGTVFVTYGFARQAIGRWPGVLAALLVALSPAILENSIVARMYTLEALFATTAWWLTWRLISDGESWSAARRTTVALALACAVAAQVWTMSLGLPSAGLQLFFGMACFVWLRTRAAGLACLCIFIGSLSLIPWLPNLVAVASDKIPFWTSRPDLLSLAGTVGAWLVGALEGPWIVLAVLAAALGVLGAVALWLGKHPADPGQAGATSGRLLALALSLAAGLVLLVWTYSQFRSIYDQRYLGSSFPAFAILISAGAAASARWLRNRGRPGRLVPTAFALALTAGLTAPMLLGAAQSMDRFRSEQGVDPARQTVDELSLRVRPGDVVMTLNAQSYFPLEYYLTRSGEAKRLGIELYHWHRPTAAFFTGWRDIDPTRVIDQEIIDSKGWEDALHLSPGSHIWLVTLNNPGYEYPRFAPAQTGSLRILDSTILEENGVTAEIWESIPNT
ncbi:MAG: glycosyltransferase family 39 protein [Candidatus Limnocylindrales bacterium]